MLATIYALKSAFRTPWHFIYALSCLIILYETGKNIAQRDWWSAISSVLALIAGMSLFVPGRYLRPRFYLVSLPLYLVAYLGFTIRDVCHPAWVATFIDGAVVAGAIACISIWLFVLRVCRNRQP